MGSYKIWRGWGRSIILVDDAKDLWNIQVPKLKFYMLRVHVLIRNGKSTLPPEKNNAWLLLIVLYYENNINFRIRWALIQVLTRSVMQASFSHGFSPVSGHILKLPLEIIWGEEAGPWHTLSLSSHPPLQTSKWCPSLIGSFKLVMKEILLIVHVKNRWNWDSHLGRRPDPWCKCFGIQFTPQPSERGRKSGGGWENMSHKSKEKGKSTSFSFVFSVLKPQA